MRLEDVTDVRLEVATDMELADAIDAELVGDTDSDTDELADEIGTVEVGICEKLDEIDSELADEAGA